MIFKSKKSQSGEKRIGSGIPRHGAGIVLIMMVLSLIFHFGYYEASSWYMARNKTSLLGANHQQPVKIRVVPKEKLPEKKVVKKEEEEKKTPDKKILETPLTPTEKPDVARYHGQQDHKTLKETKVSKRESQPKAADPGQGNAAKTQKAQVAQQPPPTKEPDLKIKPQGEGTLEIADPLKRPRNKYEALMPTTQDLREQIAAGYRDYVDDKVEEGDRIDLNTSDYRYIGYFTAMRKAIELVWNYPYEAVRRGLRGEVALEFVIAKDGSVSKVKIVGSSGHPLLDDAIVEAIKLASPFSPLPDGFAKDKLLISGSFRYVLTNYAGAY